MVFEHLVLGLVLGYQSHDARRIGHERGLPLDLVLVNVLSQGPVRHVEVVLVEELLVVVSFDFVGVDPNSVFLVSSDEPEQKNQQEELTRSRS